MKDFTFVKNRAYLQKRMGDIAALAGAKRYELTDGKAKGVEAVDIKTGAGLEFTVLPGRGMDIAWASYKSLPVSFISKTGIVSPSYYESNGNHWLRNFFGGLLTTCGLVNAGPPSERTAGLTGKQEYGLHGRISNSAADNVCVSETWQGDELTIKVSGRVKEAKVFGECLVLYRELSVIAGENKIFINDVIENISSDVTPLMVLYHINAGYPLVDKGTKIITRSRHIEPANEYSKGNLDNAGVMEAPEKGKGEFVYFHDADTDTDGRVFAAAYNPFIEYGMVVRFNKSELPYLTTWKACEEQDYAIGLEPANCLPLGYERSNEKGMLEFLSPFQSKKIGIEIGIFEGTENIF